MARRSIPGRAAGPACAVPMRPRCALIPVAAALLALSYLCIRGDPPNVNFGKLLNRRESRPAAGRGAVKDGKSESWQRKDGTAHRLWKAWAKKDQEVQAILARLDQMMPRVTFTDVQTTTSAKHSRASLLNPRSWYCVGDHLLVRLDAYDYLGKRKEYGGDFLRARIHSPLLKAGAAGLITDYRNGTYLVNFTLFWEGTARVSLMVVHPSEGVSALWAARKRGFDKITFTGHFRDGTRRIFTTCGFNFSTQAELCEYRDERDQEAFYCVKPKDVPCGAFILLQSRNQPVSYLTALEKELFDRANIGVEIPQTLGDIPIGLCNHRRTVPSRKCAVGMPSPLPSGFVWQDQWHPAFCSMAAFPNVSQVNDCLSGKLLYFLGDSTVRQWIDHLTKRVRTLRYFDVHDSKNHQAWLAVDVARNIQVHWRKHGHPFVTTHTYTVRGHSYISRVMDHVAGDRNMAVVIGLGQHFRPFPIELFVRRVLNIRASILHLLLRSPDTRVIIKAENTREMDTDPERFSDLHGYVQNLVVRDAFQGLNVGFVDAWDMTLAYATNSVHPPEHVVWNQMDLFLTYIC